jgi:TetR/AcrR family transcriptional regulator
MKMSDTSKFNQAHLAQWLEASRHYLFSDSNGESPMEVATSPCDAASQPAIWQRKQPGADPVEHDADPAEDALLQLRLDTHGARVRFISRLRGKLLRRVKRSTQWNVNPLQELEHVFFSHVSFIARNPDVARRMLAWLLPRGDVRIRRRVQAVVDCYASHLARRIEYARQQGFIRAGISPYFAANFFVSLIQGLVLGKEAGLFARDEIFRKTAHAFAVYRNGLAAPAPGVMLPNIFSARFGWNRT